MANFQNKTFTLREILAHLLTHNDGEKDSLLRTIRMQKLKVKEGNFTVSFLNEEQINYLADLSVDGEEIERIMSMKVMEILNAFVKKIEDAEHKNKKAKETVSVLAAGSSSSTREFSPTELMTHGKNEFDIIVLKIKIGTANIIIFDDMREEFENILENLDSLYKDYYDVRREEVNKMIKITAEEMMNAVHSFSETEVKRNFNIIREMEETIAVLKNKKLSIVFERVTDTLRRKIQQDFSSRRNFYTSVVMGLSSLELYERMLTAVPEIRGHVEEYKLKTIQTREKIREDILNRKEEERERMWEEREARRKEERRQIDLKKQQEFQRRRSQNQGQRQKPRQSRRVFMEKKGKVKIDVIEENEVESQKEEEKESTVTIENDSTTNEDEQDGQIAEDADLEKGLEWDGSDMKYVDDDGTLMVPENFMDLPPFSWAQLTDMEDEEKKIDWDEIVDDDVSIEKTEVTFDDIKSRMPDLGQMMAVGSISSGNVDDVM